MTIGKKIRQERTYKKLSQKQLAELVCMSDPAMQNYELGNRTPSQKQIKFIASALEVSPFTLSDPDLDTYYRIIHALFYLENKINLQTSTFTMSMSDQFWTSSCCALLSH